MKWAKIGFLTGGMIPVGIGLYMLAQIIAYEAAHPLGPNMARCGMPMLGALLLLMIVSPIGGAIGAFAGILCSLIFDPLPKRTIKPPGDRGR